MFASTSRKVSYPHDQMSRCQVCSHDMNRAEICPARTSTRREILEDPAIQRLAEGILARSLQQLAEEDAKTGALSRLKPASWERHWTSWRRVPYLSRILAVPTGMSVRAMELEGVVSCERRRTPTSHPSTIGLPIDMDRRLKTA